MLDARIPWRTRLRQASNRTLQALVRRGPAPLRRVAARVPYSRWSPLALGALRGREVTTWRGCALEVDPGELSGYYLYVMGDYEPTEIDTLIDLCRDARVFADIGSHAGYTALAIARACPGLETFAFEPDANAAARFERNLVLNPDLAARIHLEHAAMGDAVGHEAFAPAGDPTNTQVGRLAANGVRAPRTVSVRVSTLDAFFAERSNAPDVVKIDVEGAELRVLRGMSRLLASGRPRAMVIEVHGMYFDHGAGAFQEELARLLTSSGFCLRRLHDGAWRAAGEARSWPGRCHLLCTRERAAPHLDVDATC
jgi:FkbM family methyltransferase